MPTLQTLGQSVNHWQVLYILSITIALLSTFAIVVFAFHIQQHKFGLKVSNYIYVCASLLAVISTIVIVNKTHSLDAEKDRITGMMIAQAQEDTAVANQNALTPQATASTPWLFFCALRWPNRIPALQFKPKCLLEDQPNQFPRTLLTL